MRPGGGRQKGNAFERKVAKQIVRAFRKFGITNADCYRTPLSGGHRYSRQTDPGDLVISPKLHRYFPAVVECKKDRRWDWSHLFLPPKQRQTSWVEDRFINQAWRQCPGDFGGFENGEHGSFPLLVVGGNNAPAMVLLPLSCVEHLGKFSEGVTVLHNTDGEADGQEEWVVFPLDSFLRDMCRSAKTK